MRVGKFFLVLALIESIVILLSGTRAYYKVRESKQEVRKVEEKLNRVKMENERLKKEEENAKNPSYLEKLAREKLGLAKKNEIIYKIIP